jgi:hypothetical protein
MDPAELERLMHRALRALPEPRAPRTLLPRVLAAVAAEASRPWYGRAWASWPLHWQLVSAAVAIMVMAAATVVGPGMAAGMLEFAARTSLPLSTQLTVAISGIGAIWEAAQIVWEIVAPAARVVALWLLVMSAACVAFGTALDRVIALGGAAES